MSDVQCVVCGSGQWLKLPDPSNRKSVTTAGSIIDEPLGKSQCAACGFVQRTEYPYLGSADFYENRYTTYYGRPGMEAFNSQHYVDIAQWLSDALGEFTPDSIVEVGCGRGWTLREISAVYPQAIVEGIEPSLVNSDEARRSGIAIHTAKLDKDNIPDKQYDVVFSNHVLQHTTDPVGVFKAMGEITSSRGRIVVTVNDASIPNNELLYSDPNFSFLPTHIVRLAERAGLRMLSRRKAPDSEILKFSQLFVFCKQDHEGGGLRSDPLPNTNAAILEDLYGKRKQYIEVWSKIDDYLCWKTERCRNVYNFGAGLYSYLLACYCESYWKRVASCTVDRFSGQCVGKRVVPFEELQLSDRDCIVIGTRPGIQRDLALRLKNLGRETVCWDNFIDG